MGEGEIMDYHELFEYRSGELFNKITRGSSAKAGTVAGGTSQQGYRRVVIAGSEHQVHRIIWEMHNGEIPKNMQIDHISGVKDNNNISNLRIVTHQGNQRNQRVYKNNVSGKVGVSRVESTGKWRAVIKVDSKRLQLGYFADFHEAVKARKQAEVKYGFHENHGRQQ